MIRAMEEQHVPEAAALLVRRHAEHLRHAPLLAPLDQDRAEAEVAALLGAEGATGRVLMTGGSVESYLIAVPHQETWLGRDAYVHAEGWAGAGVAELYAEAAQAWCDAGRLAHYVMAPASQVEPWFHLGFGVQHVHAAKPVDASAPHPPSVRRATRADIPVLARLDLVLDETLRASPVFSRVSGTTVEEAVAEWERDFGVHTVLVADTGEGVVGSAIALDVTGSSVTRGLLRPGRAAFLGFAAVLPEARGRRLGTDLGRAVEHWAASQRYEVVCADWRSANLAADRTWRRLGYRPTYLRLHRQLAP